MKVSTQRRSPRAQQTSMPLTWTMTGYSLNYRLLTDSNMSMCVSSLLHTLKCVVESRLFMSRIPPLRNIIKHCIKVMKAWMTSSCFQIQRNWSYYIWTSHSQKHGFGYNNYFWYHYPFLRVTFQSVLGNGGRCVHEWSGSIISSKPYSIVLPHSGLWGPVRGRCRLVNGPAMSSTEPLS